MSLLINKNVCNGLPNRVIIYIKAASPFLHPFDEDLFLIIQFLHLIIKAVYLHLKVSDTLLYRIKLLLLPDYSGILHILMQLLLPASEFPCVLLFYQVALSVQASSLS